MQVIKYKDNKGKEQKAIEVNSLLNDLEYAESFFGCTSEKIVEQYYNIKRQLFEIIHKEELEEENGSNQS